MYRPGSGSESAAAAILGLKLMTPAALTLAAVLRVLPFAIAAIVILWVVGWLLYTFGKAWKKAEASLPAPQWDPPWFVDWFSTCCIGFGLGSIALAAFLGLIHQELPVVSPYFYDEICLHLLSAGLGLLLLYCACLLVGGSLLLVHRVLRVLFAMFN